MKILTHNATARMFEKVNSIRHMHSSWRCIQLRLSALPQRNSTQRTHFVLRGITELLEDDEGYVYLCHDHDIFILFQGRTHSILKKLTSYFADLESDEMCSVYDLEKDWAFFFSICYRKSLRSGDDWASPAKNPPASRRLMEVQPTP
ncbi:MAG: hypothetical protein SFX19_07125 [Alphaproteobacteria bacterium]|nr:hypothetical protein [Alphaproteobacteria bacterium]